MQTYLLCKAGSRPMDVDQHYARGVLDDLHATRLRARATGSDVVAAALTAFVCAGGAIAFVLEAQTTRAVCGQQDILGCVASTNEFDGWAYWMIAAAAATVVAMVIRHLRGLRRATMRRWLGRLLWLTAGTWVAALFAGYGWSSLGTDMPFVFPAAAPAVVALFAARRRQPMLAVGLGALSAAIVIVGMRARMAHPAWWFDHNAGYVASSVVAAAAAAFVAVRWYRKDHA